MLKEPFKSLALSIAVMLLLVVGLAYASVRIQDNQAFFQDDLTQYAVIFKPHQSHTDVLKKIINAGGAPVRSGRFDFIQIVASSGIDFQENLYQHGALFVFKPIITGACYVQNKSRMSTQVLNKKEKLT